MSFMEETIQQSMDIWEAWMETRFLDRMANDTLPWKRFCDYIVQDSIYLRAYLRTFAYAMAKSRTLREMQQFYSVLGFVNDGENVTRLTYLREFDMTDEDIDKTMPRRQCLDYCDFLLETGVNGSVEQILMAVMPCMLGYQYVFERLKTMSPQVAEGYYAPLVADYTSEGYKECCKIWTEICEDRCAGLDAEERAGLQKIFRQGSLHELYFWQMAGEGM